MSSPSKSSFFYEPAQLESAAQTLLQMAREQGASDASVEVSEHSGLSVTARMGQLETIERTRDRAASITVYKGHRKGHATSADLREDALLETVRRAADLASFTAEDPFSGLPDAEDIETSPRTLDLYRPWSIEADAAADLALACESAARGVSPLIRNSDGASVSANHGQFVMANSRGFMGGFPSSRHWLSVAPIAQQGDAMQRDDWYGTSRDPAALGDPRRIGEYAARRALSRLGARRIPTMTCPVIFEAPLAIGLVGALVQALSGSALYRRASFLLDSMGEQIFPQEIMLDEDPFVPLGAGSSPFDDEGVKVRARRVIDGGTVSGYFLSSYSARKMGMKTTGNAGGSHNLRFSSRKTRASDDLESLLRKMGRGLLVTEVMGQGVNGLTGDYSRGVFGYWVEHGQIQHPVEEVTIAGNLKDMFKGMVAVGADEVTRGNKTCGSILIDSMTIAGA
ncbi:TldD Predicted Zn-dependent proteases and their inactivated homologs [Burkholderiales bacterium]